MRANPSIEVSVSSPSYAWLCLNGEAVFENNPAAKDMCMQNPIVKGAVRRCCKSHFRGVFLTNARAVLADFSATRRRSTSCNQSFGTKSRTKAAVYPTSAVTVTVRAQDDMRCGPKSVMLAGLIRTEHSSRRSITGNVMLSKLQAVVRYLLFPNCAFALCIPVFDRMCGGVRVLGPLESQTFAADLTICASNKGWGFSMQTKKLFATYRGGNPHNRFCDFDKEGRPVTCNRPYGL